MSSIDVEVAPEQAGFDAKRLARLDTHFARYVDDGRLAGWHIVVARDGRVAHSSVYGQRDAEAGLPVEPDTQWRIYSMTKPVTSVAAMMLWEEGHFELTDPISRWLPEFADARVYQKGSAGAPYTVPAVEPIRVWHLLTHTSGLTYGFLQTSVVDALYRQAGYDIQSRPGTDLAQACRDWAKLPLLFQPGTAWGYGVSTDVLGRLVELWSGRTLQDFVRERILEPLGMTDTCWSVEPDSDRLAALYVPGPDGRATRYDTVGKTAFEPPDLASGGGGLISTAADYHRFLRLLLQDGTFEHRRLLSRRTVGFMTRNHLPGGVDLDALQTGGFAETTFEGVGFGLGFAVVRDPVPARVWSSPGTYYWGGAASTAFWVDPVERLTVALYTQLLPSSTHPLRPQLRQLVYSALTD
ncbi:serine hydrolase domain-containing protein [Dactylosporangium sp. AC04546]|uniref:serine hydrolase domain-containing protein n=1 Tax=Dactylosporangium sp. AC04546 TaxID=2862460 RepID=UPI001EE13BED|nr:serine hydrolase domain-containing protein [Dactylosporangium sp. AC04546]WVK81910.1 serine hydrolase domain-containing protein [Dactylosporangium sp. AC04546]